MISGILQAIQESANRHKVWAGIGIVVAILAAVIWLPKLSFIQPGGNLTPADRAKAESDLRGHLLQALGGLVLVAGAYFTGRTFALNREGQITERFTRAVEQLANHENLEIRLGGIYALERIARDSETHHEPVMEVLTAFVREHARWPGENLATRDSAAVPAKEASREPAQPVDIPELRVDFQAIATVLGRRDRSHEGFGYRLDLRGVDLRRVWLLGADLERAALEGAHLECADLLFVNLEGADLSGAHLEGARLANVRLKLANLRDADLSETTGLTREDLAKTITDGATLPQDFLGDFGGEAGDDLRGGPGGEPNA